MTARILRAVIAAAGPALLLPGGVARAQVTIAGKPYTKLDTRQATREAVMKQFTGVSVRWGEWKMLAPFEHPGGAKDVATPFPPESQLEKMKAGAEIDLSATYPGKDGKPIAWHTVTQQQDIGGLGGLKPLDFRAGLTPEQIRNQVGYLYRSLTVDAPANVPVSMGSDDGLRAWLNGDLIVESATETPLDPEAHQLVLKLRAGVNHLFIKVTQGGGEWEFQMAERLGLDPAVEAALDYQLDSDFPDAESKYYRIITVPTPPGEVVEVGGLAVMPAPDRRPILSTRRGDIFLVGNAYEEPPLKTAWTRFATGLQEPLGVALRPDKSAKGGVAVYSAQRSELTKMVDTDGDDVADALETYCADWVISGNYHEYAFGPKFDREGNAWVTLNLAHTGGETVMGATVPTRGCAVKITPDGVLHKVADGLRSPDGIGMFSDGQMFYTDNQGDYVGTNKLSPLFQDSFHGHQASLKFREGYGPDWRKDGKPVPERVLPAVWFPYQKMGQSASDILLNETGGRFGPFDGQLFIGDQTHATVMRVFLEKLGPENPGDHPTYQGACFPFRQGFASGVHRLAFSDDGSMFVGMTDRGWGSTGPKRFGLQRLKWTGQVPLEIKQMRARPDGFDLEFTRDVDPASATSPASYTMISYTYEYHPDYGSAEMDSKPQTIVAATLVDPKTVHLAVGTLRVGYVHELDAPGVRDKGGAEPLLHSRAYYTLERIPAR